MNYRTNLQRKCACGGTPGPTGECEECRKKRLQRKERNEPGIRSGSTVPPIVDEVLRSPGQPLNFGTRTFFESRFGHDLSKVRVHANTAANQSADAVKAQAYTVGSNVVFASGQYAPSTPAGKRLLAHELVHTIQQGASYPINKSLKVGAPHDTPEMEAAELAGEVMLGKKFRVTQRVPAILARQPAPAPSPGLTDEEIEQRRLQEKFKPAESHETGRTPPGAISTWGWGGPETENIYQECTVAPMDRKTFRGFVKSLPSRPQRNKAKGMEEVMGITNFDPNLAVPPKIETAQVPGQKKPSFKLKPTHAEMPPIKSAYTKIDDPPKEFIEGSQPYAKDDCRDFWHSVSKSAPGRYDVIWLLPDDGAEMFRQMELEHCNDIRLAFDLTLGLFASSLNNLAASERTYSSEKQATEAAVKSVGVPPEEMIVKFYQAASKTELRDGRGWHTAIWQTKANAQEPDPLKNQCRGYIRKLDSTTGPEVGKHPSSEVITTDPVRPAAKLR